MREILSLTSNIEYNLGRDCEQLVVKVRYTDQSESMICLLANANNQFSISDTRALLRNLADSLK